MPINGWPDPIEPLNHEPGESAGGVSPPAALRTGRSR